MTLLEQIEKQLSALPPEKQGEVLDFIAFLQQRSNVSKPARRVALKKHPAFGSWKNRHIDALNGVEEADAEFNSHERVLISRVTWMEVLIGAEGEDAEVRDFLENHFEIIPLDLAVAEKAIELRRVHRIRLPDAII